MEYPSTGRRFTAVEKVTQAALPSRWILLKIGPEDLLYTLHYSWPYRLIGPLFALCAFVFPLLIRFVDGSALGWGDMAVFAILAASGAAISLHYARKVMVTADHVIFSSIRGTKSVPWKAFLRVDDKGGYFVLTAIDGQRHRVAMEMKHGSMFAKDLDVRFRPDGTAVFPAG